jgi:serine/threonine protein kinase
MSTGDGASSDSDSLDALNRIDEACDSFEAAWRAGQRPRIEDWLAKSAIASDRSGLLRELLMVELRWREQHRERPERSEYLERFRAPDDVAVIMAVFRQDATATARATGAMAASSHDPAKIGRYRVVRRLGQGGFGRVYLAHDDELDRPIAIKVPNPERVKRSEDIEAYLAEARALARLDHPHIVPVYDVGRTSDGLCYVVSKFVEGSDLAQRLRQGRPPLREAVEMVATVAEALHHAHTRDLVHRDIKPANILLDVHGKPCVADFGLALRDEHYGRGARLLGTPGYMSPEQARGEGHRVDGRSDIFSLTVVLYELLVGRRPFRGDTSSEVMDQIANAEPRPLRQIDDTIPKELERICQKGLAKRASERCSTALDLADDLRHFLQTDSARATPETARADGSGSASGGSPIPGDEPSPSPARPDSDVPAVKIIPKGLRSFDQHDAGFFLELLPGPRNRDGVPESIRFWKMKIEAADSDTTFKVGLIYGPSGCGKSSLVKAGLLPRIGKQILPVYVEATAEETEARLLRAVRKVCPDLPIDRGAVDSLAAARSPLESRLQPVRENRGLVNAFAAVRRGRVLTAGRKVLLVLDQFEQWLHAKRGDANTELSAALRQCDGEHLQAIVLVRDDFWLAVSRFMADLEVELLQGQNTALVDLFDQRHARKVLTAFGAAYGNLPERPSEMSKDQSAFLDQAISELAQDGKVISVRLALFGEMMKGKPWTPASLRAVGGTEGVGVTFLEETFSSPQAHPKHRLHQKGAQAVLRALLPEAGTDIKGQLRSEQELREAAAYSARPRDFAELMHILDAELRLITPTEAEAVEGGAWRVAGAGAIVEGQQPTAEGAGSDPSTLHPPPSTLSPPVTLHPSPSTRFYQLTHDYLVHSLRNWLTRKQRETRRGRAQLRLEERSSLWNAKPENRHLPSLVEWLCIRTLTDSAHWTEPQRKMMRQAGRTHGRRSALALAGVIAVAVAGVTLWNQVAQRQEVTRIEGLVGGLVSAEPSQVPDVVKRLDANPEVAARFLLPLISGKAETPDAKRAQLHARLAMVSRDPSQVEPLVVQLLAGKVLYVLPIRQLLRPAGARLTERFRGLLRDGKADPERRFRAALALADYVPASEAASWTDGDMKFVAGELVSANADYQPLYREALRPIHTRLLDDLERSFADAHRTLAERMGAANAPADYAEKDIARLARLLAIATKEQFTVLYPIVAAGRTSATIEDLGKIAATLPPDALGSVERVAFGQKRAGAAVTLLRLDERERALPVFEATDDPEALTQFIIRCRERGVGVDALLDCLEQVTSGPANRYPRDARYALLLALGECKLTEVPESRRDALIKQLAGWYRHDPSSGVHGAAGWLLRRWDQADLVRQVDQTPIPYAPDREWFTLRITVKPTHPPEPREGGPTEDAGANPASAKTDAASKAGAVARSAAPGEAGKAKPAAPAAPPPKTFYYTFIVFPPGEFTIGSEQDEPGRRKGRVEV